MSDVIANLFIYVHPSKAKLILCHDGNCFLIASTVGVYSLCLMLLRVLADDNTNSLLNTFHEHRISKFAIASHGESPKINTNMR